MAPPRAGTDAVRPEEVSIEVRQLTVGPIGENCFVVRPEGGEKAVVVDPGEEAERILAAVEEAGAEVEAILITHCHFDHIGAVTPVAKATGAPVYCPELEVPALADIMSFTMSGFGPFEGYEADETVAGGEALELAGMTLDVISTPGHSPGHVTYSVRGEDAIFSGDVLFQGSVGRVDLPGGDGPTLLRSIQGLIESHPPETAVYPGHMGATTLGAERATNPFLAGLPS
ncbi:MAG: MBL fold metallo-hydrolase [Chloroflexota bacterium]